VAARATLLSELRYYGHYGQTYEKQLLLDAAEEIERLRKKAGET